MDKSICDHAFTGAYDGNRWWSYLKYIENLGYDKNVVIRTKLAVYRMKPANYLWLVKIRYRKYPKFVEALENRYKMYNETVEYISEREKAGKTFVFQSDTELLSGIAERNPEKLMISYNHRREIVRRKWDEFMEWRSTK